MDQALLLWGLGLLAASLLLIVIEVFVPSGGLIALVAAGCAIGGIVALFRYHPWWGVIGIAVLLILAPMAFSFAIRVWPSTPLGRRMLGERSPEEIEAARERERRQHEELRALIGQQGTVLTDLRPVGLVQIGNRRYDAISETGYVRAGQRVRVAGADSMQLRVRPVSSA